MYLLFSSNILFEFSYHGYEFKYIRSKYVFHTPIFTVHTAAMGQVIALGLDYIYYIDSAKKMKLKNTNT